MRARSASTGPTPGAAPTRQAPASSTARTDQGRRITQEPQVSQSSSVVVVAGAAIARRQHRKRTAVEPVAHPIGDELDQPLDLSVRRHDGG